MPRKMIFMAVDFIRRNKAEVAAGREPPHRNVIRVWDPRDQRKSISCVRVKFEGMAEVVHDPADGAEHLGRPDVHAWVEVDGSVTCFLEDGTTLIV